MQAQQRVRRSWQGIGALALALLLLGCTPGAFDEGDREDSEPTVATTAERFDTDQSPTPAPSPTERGRVSVAAMGDMLPHDSVVWDAELPDGGYDFAQFFDALRPVYEQRDLVYCNQEAPSAGDVLPLDYFPAFNAPADFARGLAAAGCNTVGLANNHSFDQGQVGIDATRSVWDDLDPELIGGVNRDQAEQDALAVTELNGVRVAFASFTDLANIGSPATSVNALSDIELVDRLMREAEQVADATIVAVHWGEEYSPTVNERQREQAERLAELGADVIIGTHPHVLQEAEWLERSDGGESLVWYSIGNALTAQMAIERVLSVVAQFDLVLGTDGEVTVEEAQAVPFYTHFDLTPQQFVDQDWIHRSNFQLYPLADAAEPLTRSAWRDELTVDDARERVQTAIGDAVELTER